MFFHTWAMWDCLLKVNIDMVKTWVRGNLKGAFEQQMILDIIHYERYMDIYLDL